MSKFVTAALAACASITLASTAAGATLVNGSFEFGTLNHGNYARGVLPTGWSAVQNLEAPDIITNAYAAAFANHIQGYRTLVDAQDGTRFIDLNGATATGGLYQDVTVPVGRELTLSYWVSRYAQNSAGSVTAQLIGAGVGASRTDSIVFNNTVTTSEWVKYTLTGVAQQSTVRVQFTGSAPGCCDIAAPGLDDVSLTVGVPEPSTWAVMIGGFGLAGAALRRRARAIG